MAERFGDAREEELRLLLEVESGQGQMGFHEPEAGPRRDLIAWLLAEDLVGGPGAVRLGKEPRVVSLPSGQTVTQIEYLDGDKQADLERRERLNAFLSDQVVERVRLSHKGRVRISELQQALRSDRTRDRSGLLDGAHAERGLRLAILYSASANPLAVAYLDANGLKEINDRFGHDAGDLYLTAYAEAVLTAVGGEGEAYRLHGGGDEVLVLLHAPVAKAIETVRLVNAALAAQQLRHGQELLPPGSLCAGIVVVQDPRAAPADVQTRADLEMNRAKGESRGKTPRPAVVAVEGKPVVIL